MRLWADVYNAQGERLGEGAIRTVKNASVNRVLDGAGTISLSTPLNDDRALELLRNEARIRLYIERNGATRELARGIIKDRSLNTQDGGKSMNIQALDDLEMLKRYNTFLGRIYPSQSALSIAQNLAALAGWSCTGSGGALDVTARYDGASVLKALQELAELQGLHLRLGESVNTVEIGEFGDLNPLVIMGANRAHFETYANDDIAFIETLTVAESSEAVANVFVPLGQGEGESALTLAKATRSSPYPIRTMVVNGKNHYYLQDDESVALYGTIQKVGTYRQIGAVSNSEADLVNGANALYDAAAQWLKRYSKALTTYECTIVKANRLIRPGQKIRLVYKGLVYTREGKATDWVNIDSEFWVMEARESFGVEGGGVSLTLASVDRVQLDAAQLIIGALEAIELHNTRIQTYPSVRSFVYRRELDPTHAARIPILLTETTTQLNRAILQLTTRPFRTTVRAAQASSSVVGSTASGGGATTSAGGAATSSSGGGANVTSGAENGTMSQTGGVAGQSGSGLPNSGGNHTHFGSVFSHNHTVNIPNHTHTVPDHTHTVPAHTHNITIPAHNHDLDYGIEDDSQRPNTVRIEINGVDVTAALGGAWGVGGGAIDVTLDITQFLVGASGGLRQRHRIDITCDGGQGEIEATVELYETIQSIAVL